MVDLVSSSDNAVIATGTSCADSSRFRAVTIISSMTSADSAATTVLLRPKFNSAAAARGAMPTTAPNALILMDFSP